MKKIRKALNQEKRWKTPTIWNSEYCQSSYTNVIRSDAAGFTITRTIILVTEEIKLGIMTHHFSKQKSKKEVLCFKDEEATGIVLLKSSSLPSMSKAVGSIPNTTKKQKKTKPRKAIQSLRGYAVSYTLPRSWLGQSSCHSSGCCVRVLKYDWKHELTIYPSSSPWPCGMPSQISSKTKKSWVTHTSYTLGFFLTYTYIYKFNVLSTLIKTAFS